MPTRKISDRERLTLWARGATDDEIAEAEEIIRVEKAARKATKLGPNPGPRKARTQRVPGPPNPPKPDNDNPQG